MPPVRDLPSHPVLRSTLPPTARRRLGRVGGLLPPRSEWAHKLRRRCRKPGRSAPGAQIGTRLSVISPPLLARTGWRPAVLVPTTHQAGHAHPGADSNRNEVKISASPRFLPRDVPRTSRIEASYSAESVESISNRRRAGPGTEWRPGVAKGVGAQPYSNKGSPLRADEASADGARAQLSKPSKLASPRL